MSYGSWLASTGRRASNPAEGIPVWRQHPGLPRPLPPEECRRLLAELTHRTDMFAVAVVLMLYTGTRNAETASLRWADWDGAHWLRVLGKGGKEREVPTPPPLVRSLQRWRAVCPSAVWIFPGAHGPVHTATLRRHCMELTGVNPHRLRHHYATALLEESSDITVVQAALGHANIQQSLVYAQTSSRRLAEAADRLYGDAA